MPDLARGPRAAGNLLCCLLWASGLLRLATATTAAAASTSSPPSSLPCFLAPPVFPSPSPVSGLCPLLFLDFEGLETDPKNTMHQALAVRLIIVPFCALGAVAVPPHHLMQSLKSLRVGFGCVAHTAWVISWCGL